MSCTEYHHGNLKHTLIEAGIQVMNEKGSEALSLRKLAAICHVSVAAPYAHFQSKDELIQAMQEYVTSQFMCTLSNAVQSYSLGSEEAIFALGEAYITFFLDHPQYFRFLFFTPYLRIQLSAKEPVNPYPPYELFHKHAITYFQSKGFKEDEIRSRLTNMWGSVQGIAMLAASPNVTYEGNMREDIHRIVRNQ